MEAWQDFVVRYGRKAAVHELAHVLGRTEKEVARLRQTGVFLPRKDRIAFSELFTLWNGRAPVDADWPVPRRSYRKGTYEWQGREDALLASLVGQFSVPHIVATLTERLRQVTGDPKAGRVGMAVQIRIGRIGLQAGDLVGGMTVQEAGREIGSVNTVQGAIARKTLRPRRVGHRLLIARDQWEAWKASRTFPPKGYVVLASIREQLGILSDAKLPEFAKCGYVPTAIQCNPFGSKGSTASGGTWYVDGKVARKLLRDREAGRPMPWHGKPMNDNLKATWKRLQDRRHPQGCEMCAAIWGAKGAPTTWADYLERYPPLTLGAKRHLTRVWTPGLTIDEVAKQAKKPRAAVLRALRNGVLRGSEGKGRRYVSRTDATRWIARHCPTGDGTNSWVSIESACKQYHFTPKEVRGLIRKGELKSKVGTDGAMRGITYVLRQQCIQLRELHGFTEQQAAKRLGISVPRLQRLLRGVQWRPAPLIPLLTLQAVQKRLESREGFDLDEAAAELGQPLQWVKDRIADGTARVARAQWDRRRKYLSAPMLERLRAAVDGPVRLARPGRGALTLDQAALDAKVSTTTLKRWAEAGELERIKTTTGWRYPRRGVRTRAEKYWSSSRWKRDLAPAWFTASKKDRT